MSEAFRLFPYVCLLLMLRGHRVASRCAVTASPETNGCAAFREPNFVLASNFLARVRGPWKGSQRKEQAHCPRVCWHSSRTGAPGKIQHKINPARTKTERAHEMDATAPHETTTEAQVGRRVPNKARVAEMAKYKHKLYSSLRVVRSFA